jgi:hypothetical protein
MTANIKFEFEVWESDSSKISRFLLYCSERSVIAEGEKYRQ